MSRESTIHSRQVVSFTAFQAIQQPRMFFLFTIHQIIISRYFFAKGHPPNDLRMYHSILMILKRNVTNPFRSSPVPSTGVVAIQAIQWGSEEDTTRSRRIVSRTECRGRLRPVGAMLPISRRESGRESSRGDDAYNDNARECAPASARTFGQPRSASAHLGLPSACSMILPAR